MRAAKLVVVAAVSAAACRHPKAQPTESTVPPAAVASPSAPPRADAGMPSKSLHTPGAIDLTDPDAKMRVVETPAWPADPAPIVDVTMRIFGANEAGIQEVETVVRIGSVSRSIVTRHEGSVPIAPWCPELPDGGLTSFSMKDKEHVVVSFGFYRGGSTTLSVERKKADALVVDVVQMGDSDCSEGCSPFVRGVAVIPIPAGAKTRARVLDVYGDGDRPWECANLTP